MGGEGVKLGGDPGGGSGTTKPGGNPGGGGGKKGSVEVGDGSRANGETKKPVETDEAGPEEAAATTGKEGSDTSGTANSS